MNIRAFCDNINGIIQIVSNEKKVEGIALTDLNVTLKLLKQAMDSLTNEFAAQPVGRENTVILCELLAKRWEMIGGTDFAYPNAPDWPANLICLALAQELEQIHGKSRYQLLMPTIQVVSNEVSATEINEHALELKEFVLSDDNQRIIDIVPCLDFAAEDGVLKHTSLFDGQVKKLSDDEATRVTQHSPFTLAYYNAVLALVEVKTHGISFGAVLTRLMNCLRIGGAHGNKGGQELNAAAAANEQIFNFSEWLGTLTEKDREKLCQCRAAGLTNNFGEIWGRLARPNEADYVSTIYCVELIAGELSQILAHNQWLFDTFPENSQAAAAKCSLDLAQDVREKREALIKALHQPNYSVCARYGAGSDNKMCHYLKTLIANYIDLINVMNLINVDACAYLLEIIGADIQNIINDPQVFVALFGYLQQNKKNILISKIGDKLIPIINNSYYFRHLYLRLPEESKQEIMLLHEEKIFNNAGSASDLMSYIQNYPEAERLEICIRHAENFASRFQSVAEVYALLNMLKKQDRVIALRALFDIVRIVKSGPELVQLLSCMVEQDKAELLTMFADTIHLLVPDFALLIPLLVHVPQVDRLSFIQAEQDWIFDLVMNGDQLALLLCMFPGIQRKTVLEMVGADLKIIIQVSSQLILCLAALSEQDQPLLLEWISDDLNEIIMDDEDLDSVLKPVTRLTRDLLKTYYQQNNMKKREMEDALGRAQLVSSVKTEEPKQDLMVVEKAVPPPTGIQSVVNNVFSFFSDVKEQVTQQFSVLHGISRDESETEKKRKVT